MSAARLLALGWSRHRRRAWVATAAVLAVTLVLLVLTAGLFGGMQSATESRVADIYTGQLRITPERAGILGPGLFADATDATAQLGTAATPRMESQALLGRRGFLEAIVTEDEQFGFRPPGAEGDRDAMWVGVLVGVPFQDPIAAAPYGRHITDGALPGSWQDGDPVPLVLSTRTLSAFLTAEEKAALGDPPAVSDLRNLRFEVTAATVTGEGASRDVIRHPAVVVGLYETGVETLDIFTAWAPIEVVRVLLGYPAEADVATALIVGGPGRNAAVAVAVGNAEDQGWASEDSAAFTARYLGQLVSVLRTLSLVTAAVLFVVPTFLVGHAMERVLEAQRREVAVLRAIGVPARTIQAALAALVMGTVAGAILAATVLVAIAAPVLHMVLGRWGGAPLPLAIHIGPAVVVGAIGLALLSAAVAYALAMRSQARVDVAAAVRAL